MAHQIIENAEHDQFEYRGQQSDLLDLAVREFTTKQELAKALKITPAQLSRYFRNSKNWRELDFETWNKILEILREKFIENVKSWNRESIHELRSELTAYFECKGDPKELFKYFKDTVPKKLSNPLPELIAMDKNGLILQYGGRNNYYTQTLKYLESYAEGELNELALY